jgi:hypothetical protein
MRKEIVTQANLAEAKLAFASALGELHSGRETDTGKGSRFDSTLNGLLEAAFIRGASEDHAHIVPLYRPDLSSFLEGNLEQLSDFKWLYTGSDTQSRRLDEGSDLYAVPIVVETNPDVAAIPYYKESQILGGAYHAAKTLAQEIILEQLGRQNHSVLACNLQRILDKKTQKGSIFLKEYLDIIAPDSKKHLSTFPTFEELVTQRQVGLQKDSDVRLEQEQSLKDLGPVLGPLWNLMRANIR